MAGLLLYVASMRNEYSEGKWNCFARNWLAIFVAGAIAVGGASSVHAQTVTNEEQRVRSELSPLGKRGDAIAHARELVLQILHSENGCSQWFEEANAQPSEIFRSLHYQLEDKGPIYVYRMADASGELRFKQPWGARTSQDTGRNSTIRLNRNGPFFSGKSQVIYVNADGHLVGFGGSRQLAVAFYSGNSEEAQILILLHELGHIVGRLPADDDSWDGLSSQNSLQVLRHCKQEIHDVVRKAAARQ
jgi:hypothetical protein